MKYRVLVTGAGGYIGRLVVAELIREGHNVIAVDVRTEGIPAEAKVVETSIFNGNENIYTELGEPDICLHLAWRNGFIHEADSHIEDLSQHYIFLKNMINGGLKHLVVMGTMHEIGYWEGSIDEDTPTNPTSKYGIAKNCLRQAVFNLVKKNEEVILQWLRAYYITGDDARSQSIFSKIIKAEASGQKFFPFTSGKNLYDFIDVHELARQIVAATCQEDVKGIIECCTGKPISLAEKVENFIKDNQMRIKLEYGAFPDREYDSRGVWGNAKKINQILKSKVEQEE